MPNSVFYVEDSQDDIFICNHSLERCRCTVKFRIVQESRIAADWLLGRDGYADRRTYPLPRALITDIKMPQVDGFELLEMVRANEATRLLPIIILSSSTLESDRNRALALGANAYLTKTTNFFEVIQTVRPFACPVPERFCTKRRAPEICQ